MQPMVQAKGYELILGSSIDPQVGPILVFGSGGELVEVTQDRALALPPLNTTLALRLMERTRIFRALPGVRGRKPVDMNALLVQLQREFAELGVQLPVHGSIAQPLPGKPQALKRCLTNLIANAVKFGTRADIHIEDGADLLIRVRDRGPGIPE